MFFLIFVVLKGIFVWHCDAFWLEHPYIQSRVKATTTVAAAEGGALWCCLMCVLSLTGAVRPCFVTVLHLPSPLATRGILLLLFGHKCHGTCRAVRWWLAGSTGDLASHRLEAWTNGDQCCHINEFPYLTSRKGGTGLMCLPGWLNVWIRQFW